MKKLIALAVMAAVLFAAENAPEKVAPLGVYKPAERAYWAFQPRKNAVPPVVSAAIDKAWVKTPVDAFVLDGLKKAGLRPAPPASKATLIRRVTYDLTGLPPTPEEVDAFL